MLLQRQMLLNTSYFKDKCCLIIHVTKYIVLFFLILSFSLSWMYLWTTTLSLQHDHALFYLSRTITSERQTHILSLVASCYREVVQCTHSTLQISQFIFTLDISNITLLFSHFSLQISYFTLHITFVYNFFPSLDSNKKRENIHTRFKLKLWLGDLCQFQHSIGHISAGSSI